MADLCGRMAAPGVIAAMRERWGVELTPSKVGNFRQRRGIRCGVPYGRFEKGHVPYTKGKTWDEFMRPEAQERCRSTLFKAGERRGVSEALREPVGTERTRSDGYVYVKVSDESYRNSDYGKGEANRLRNHRWRARSRIAYERAYGPVPDGCHIIHADGDPANDDPENLVAVPVTLKATLSNLGNPYADRETLETAMLMAEVSQAAYRAGRSVA